jgi:hypothetical protein
MQLFPLMLLQVDPGGDATVGENELGPRPPGATAFSVGEGVTELGVVDVEGASSAC